MKTCSFCGVVNPECNEACMHCSCKIFHPVLATFYDDIEMYQEVEDGSVETRESPKDSS